MTEVCIGIDIGGTNTIFGLVDKNGRILIEDSIRTSDHEEVEDFLKALASKMNQTISEISEPIELKGIGIGAPNGNYYKGTIEFAPNLKWKGIIELVKMMKQYFPVPVFLTNDANAAAIGEMIYGGAKGMKDFFIVTLGTGVGSGFVINGNVVYGHDGFAGELGHTIVKENGRDCGCGQKGCLEAYASANGLKRTVCELIAKHSYSGMLKDKSCEDLSAKDIDTAARKGDTMALEAFEITGKILGKSLANTIAITSPEAIFLFGGLANAGKLILDPTKKHMEDNLLNIYKNKVKLLKSSLLEENAAILGSSALVWNELESL
ncbi:MAG: ROK family protein [Bacteroidales bacterium]|nr:ROK family protein [Bacteroidales bacterium]